MIDLKNINEKSIQQLVDNKVFERKTLEYKKQMDIDKDADKKEFLADISSFANKEGGVIIYGVTEDPTTGEPQSLTGLAIVNIDNEQLKISSIIRDGISPRINGIELLPVKLTNNLFCIVVSIPQSWNQPHRVTFKGHDKFYTRSTNGKYPMDIDELRNAFILSSTLTEKIEKFREGRILRIKNNQTPFPINSPSKIVLHLIPVISFNTGFKIDLKYVSDNYNKLRPPLGGGWDGQFNLNGFMTYSNSESYTLVFNSGIIEAVNSSLTQHEVQNTKGIPVVLFEQMLIECTRDYLKIQEELGITFPVYVFVTLLGMKNIRLFTKQQLWGPRIPNLDDTLDLVESKFDTLDINTIDVTLKGTIDSLYNAYGHKSSYSFDNQGRWNPR